MALPQLHTNTPVPGVIEPLTTLNVELSEAGLSMEWVAAPPATLQHPGQFTVLIGSELILCEGSVSGSKTVTILERGAEGSTKVAHPAGAKVYAPFTKSSLDNAYLSVWKRSVAVATAAALPAATYTVATQTLEANANGALTVDGVAMVVGYRVLVKNAGTGVAASRFGIYEVIQAGGAAEKWKLTRTADASTGAGLENAVVFAHQGTANAGKPWTCTNTGAIVLDTTSLTWGEAGNVNLTGAQALTGTKTISNILGAGGFAGTGQIDEMHLIRAFLIGPAPGSQGGGYIKLGLAEEAFGEAEAEVNNFQPVKAANIYSLESKHAGGTTVTGWKAPVITAAEQEGVLLVVTCTFGEITFAHENVGSLELNRFKLPGGVPLTLKEGQSAVFYYSPGKRWLLVTHT